MRITAAIIVFLLALGPGFAARAQDGETKHDDMESWRGVPVTDLTLAGNHITKDWVIAREIWTDVGDPLDPELVLDDVTRLENLALFGSVEVTGAAHEDGVALNFEFTEMPWIIPYPALNYTEENGFSAGLGVASPNFGGRGVTLSGSAVFGGATTYRFKAENPWITGNHVSAGVEAWHQNRRNKLLSFDQTSDRAALTAGKYIGHSGRLSISGGYYGVGSDEPGITLDPDNYDDLWQIGGTVGMDSRDSWRVPHDGWHNEIALLYLGGDANTWALDFDVVRYQPLGRRQTLATGPLLSLQSGRVGREIPGYMQYFMGGANSIRGYELEDLGQELYGKNQLIYNLEYRYLIAPVRSVGVFKWSFGIGLEAAVFADAGVAWSRPEDFSIRRARAGYGAGFRVLLPSVEAVRFDFGLSEDGDLIFNFGTKSIFASRKLRIR